VATNSTSQLSSLVTLQTNPFQMTRIGSTTFHYFSFGMLWLSPVQGVLYTQWLDDSYMPVVVMTDIVNGNNIGTWANVTYTLHSVVGKE
jgi:hypothetical protein